MLNSIPTTLHRQSNIEIDDRWSRNLEEDLKKSVGLISEFKKELSKLHPECVTFVENMLQRPGFR